MTQEVGETTIAIIENDEKVISQILDANKNRRDPYWIVLFAKPSKVAVDGKPTLIKFLKPYYKKPQMQVGMIVGEVDNVAGKIKWQVNMPDKPFGYEILGLTQEGYQTYETSISSAYMYN